MDNPVLQKILENTFTFSQLKHRVHLLRDYLSHRLFSESGQQFSPADLNWLNSLGEPFLKQFSKDNLNQIFNSLEAVLKNFKPLIIYLAFESNEELNRQIGLILRKNFTRHRVFDIKIDPNLIAGAAFSYNGIYKDYSLRVKINNEKEKISATFKKFLP